MYEGIGQILNLYVILKGENLGFYLDIKLKTFKMFASRTSMFLFFCTLYCIVCTENTGKLKEC